MKPGYYKIPDQYRGDSFERIDFEYFVADANPGSEMNLTGITPKMQIRSKAPAGRLYKTLTIGDGLEWTDQASGTFYLDPFIITFPEDKYYYDIEFTYADTSVVTYLRGIFDVIEDVTK